jgi:negative regulator of flagellin synthesis FlgM
MNINSNIGSIIRPDAVTTTQPVDPAAKVRTVAPASTESAASGDSVQISDAGRARAANAASGLDPARAAQIRQRVLDGAYNSLDIVDKVARRVLDSGDL